MAESRRPSYENHIPLQISIKLEPTHRLRFPPGLHNSSSPTILLHSLYIIPKSHDETGQA